MLGRGGDDMTQEELIELRQEKNQEQSQEQFAQSMAQQAAGQMGGAAPPGYWSIVGDADIDRGGEDGLADFSATETSRMFSLGNISKDDWDSMTWQIETEFWTMKNEFRDDDTELSDDDMRIMYGEERPTLNDEKARRLRSTMQVKKMMSSLSVNARGLRSGTEIHAVTKKEDSESGEGSEESGVVGRAKNWLSG